MILPILSSLLSKQSRQVRTGFLYPLFVQYMKKAATLFEPPRLVISALL